MNPILQAIGMNIRKRRKEHELTIEQLADKAGLSSKYLQGVETGKRNISVTNLYAVANALRTTLESIVHIDSQQMQTKDTKIITISERLKSFQPSQLDLFDRIINHLHTTTNTTNTQRNNAHQ